MVVGNYIVRKVLVDQGSSADVLYASTLRKLQILESSFGPYNGNLVGFFGEYVNVLEVIELRTTFGTEANIKIISV